MVRVVLRNMVRVVLRNMVRVVSLLVGMATQRYNDTTKWDSGMERLLLVWSLPTMKDSMCCSNNTLYSLKASVYSSLYSSSSQNSYQRNIEMTKKLCHRAEKYGQ